MPTTDSLLSNLGDNSQYSLKEILELHNPQQDEEPIIIDHSPYINTDDLLEVLKQKKDVFKCLSLNIQSLNAKFDELKIYLQNFEQNQCNLDAVCLQETWINERNSDINMFQLDGYQLISQVCKSTSHGGLAIYLNENIKFEVLSINVSESNKWEGLFIKLFLDNNKQLTIGNIYRPPRGRTDDYNIFLNEFDNLLKKLKGEVIIAGDFNIDLLKINEKTVFSEYFECILSNGFIPKITFPTRLTRNSGTLIDNFLCKILANFSKSTSGICTAKISDHQPYFICLDYLNIKKNKHKLIERSKFSNEALVKLKEYLVNENIMLKLTNSNNDQDTNTKYDFLHNILLTGIEKYMPTKTVKYNKHRHKDSQWITSGLIKSIKFRDKLYQKMKNTSSESPLYDQLKINLKTYNSILKKAIREAKMSYFHNRFNKFKNDMKNTWITIRNIINSNKKLSEMPSSFSINGNTTSDKQTIANEFNSFFTDIGQKLAANIVPPNNKTFYDFLRNPCNTQFQFQPILVDDTLKIIDELKPKSSKGHDHMSSTLLKKLKNELSEPLTYIINQSLEQHIFPNKLKIAKILPVYKKDNKNLLENYRPISILPAISKIFEKVIAKQINQHFIDNNLYYSSQYGFRQSHSTELTALEIVDRITYLMDQNKIPLNIYIDLSKAFDTIDHNILLQKLN